MPDLPISHPSERLNTMSVDENKLTLFYTQSQEQLEQDFIVEVYYSNFVAEIKAH